MDTRLLHIMQHGFDFHIGDYINKGFEICHKHWVTFVLGTFLYMAIDSGISYLEALDYRLKIITGFLTLPLYMGLVIMVSKPLKGELPTVGDLFEGFKYFGSLALLLIILCLAIVPIFVFAAFLGIPISGATPIVSSSYILIILGIIFPIAIFFGVCISFAPMLIVFFNLSARDALVTSYNIVNKKWWKIFGFSLILFVIVLLSISPVFIAIFFFDFSAIFNPNLYYLLMVGLLYILPAVTCAHFVSFANITKLYGDETQKNDIFDHFVED